MPKSWVESVLGGTLCLFGSSERLQVIGVVSYGYPCRRDPIWYPFVQQFSHAVAACSVRVRVVAPLPLHLAWRSRDPVRYVEHTPEGTQVEVFRPRYLSLSNRRVGRWNTALLGRESFYRAARGVLRSAKGRLPDAVYGHFLYLGGEAAVRLGHAFHIPSFPMVGEGLLNSMDPFGRERGRRHFSSATAFMTNSTCLAKLVAEELGVSRERIGVFPNGVDHRLFFPRDRHAMRRRYGLPLDLFLVICVGKQDWLKGPVRVGQAIDGLEGVGGMFLGSGTHPPKAANIVFNRPVAREQVPELLSAADLFVLPTAWEGCCNALLEAMACGLPVISSLGDFNDDILNHRVSVRVDPFNVPALRNAITLLRDDVERRRNMASAAVEWARRFDVGRRTRAILNFMSEWRAYWQHGELPPATGVSSETT